ncbi:MAG TPA: bifunctional UDP-N-acetylglucosamine diphosphorylase/glucosamine-1-phosphate N-acetyltransferase GlmU [Burkholderiaceae bacterium]|nr:bifunctional UDP-N-acetylglucosamine diphosphorylase/glucosamine-1-phosphate N-acetyltransferase GlmU [Burkholderiaceae bacterium]
MNIVILAAGQGKRMRSSLPKVLHPVAGRPMLAHVIAAARGACADVANVTVVVGHGAAAVQEAFPEAQGLHFVRQEPQLGTGHAVMQAAPHLDDAAPTLVLYGDVPLITAATLRRLLAAAGRDVGVLTVRLADPDGYGRVVRNERGDVLRVVEQKDASPAELAVDEVNTGIVVVPTAQLKAWLQTLSNDNAQREYYLTDVIGRAVQDGVRVVGVTSADADETLGVNSKEQLALVERIAQRRVAAALMDAGVTLADPARIDVRGELVTGGDVAIDVGCVFEGRVVLGDGVRVGAYCVLRNCAFGAGTELLPFTYAEDSTVGSGARLGPFSRLRPGNRLDDAVHIGNFVEIKASTIGHGSKANHLAYVGDAVVGREVNIGAGTITANYDGAHKHRTVIGDGASIGSNAVLVAPVSIGAGATIGGGSTISKDAPEGKLTVARAPQVTLDKWRRPVKQKKG